MRNGQNGRRRGRGGTPRVPGQGGQRDMGNRMVERVRGNAHQLLEKYKQLARDASQAGDRVLAEYYLQHADHYFRTLSEFRARQDEQRPQRQNGNARDDDYDDDEDFDAPEPLRVAEMTPMNGGHPQPDSQPQSRSNDNDDDGDDSDDRPARAERNVEANGNEAESGDAAEDRPRRRRRGRARRDDGEAAPEMASADA